MDQINPEIAQVLSNNRALTLGESFFTSFRDFNGKIPFAESHFRRLYETLKEFYRLNSNPQMMESLNQSLKASFQLCEKLIFDNQNQLDESLYFRITTLPVSEKFVPAQDLKFYFQISCRSLQKIKKLVNVIFKKRNEEVFIHGKLGAYQSQVNELLNHPAADEIIYLNQKDEFLEATTSNIIVLDPTQKKVRIPKKSNAIFSGIFQEKMVTYLQNNNYQILETNITQKSLASTEIILLTNSVKGLVIAQVENDKESFINLVDQLELELFKSEMKKEIL